MEGLWKNKQWDQEREKGKRERERKAQRDGYPAKEGGDLNPTVVHSPESSREEFFVVVAVHPTP